MSFVYLFILLVLVFCLLLGLIHPKMVLKGNNRTRAKVMVFYGGGIIVLFLLVGIFSTSENNESSPQVKIEQPLPKVEQIKSQPKEEPKPIAKVELKKTPEELLISKLSSTDVSIELKDSRDGIYHIVVKFDPKAIWDSKYFIIETAQTIVQLGKKIKKENIVVSTFEIHASVPTTNKYGNTGRQQALTLTINGDDFLKINWDNITKSQILNLANADFKPLGKEAAIEYCQDKDYAEFSRDFCMSAYRN